MTHDAGFGITDALVAIVLASIAFAGLTAATVVATRAITTTGTQQAALNAAAERLETGRLTRASGADVLTGPPAVARTWTHTAGRGRPHALAADAQVGDRRVLLRTEVWP